MKTKQKLIELLHIAKDYKTVDVITPALRDITLNIYTEEFIAITGPSGSGKSTLMNIIGLLDVPTKGTYILNGTNVTKFSQDKLSDMRNKEIGFVFQSFNLLPRITTLENVMLPAIYAGVKRSVREANAREILTKLGLSDRLQNKPNQLSGGQQQRVAIARALMNDPNIILADEPTGNLDSKSGQDVMNILKELNNEGKIIILITHEHDIAKQAKKIIHIRDGKIVS